MPQRKKVVILGGGFAGINAAKKLKRANVEITLIDKTNHHLFQPLLYQVATAALSPGNIAAPLRHIFAKQRNMRVVMDEVTNIDRENQVVQLKNQAPIGYDYLIVAVGNRPTYYGNDHFRQYAPHLKSIDNALTIRDRILISFEMASREPDPVKRRKYLTFVMVGGGPTGVEMAGAISEIGPKILRDEFPQISAKELGIYVLEGADRILGAYDPKLSDRARRDLQDMGVKVVLNKMVEDVGEDYVKAGDLKLETVNVVWAAGNEGVPVLKTLATEQLRDGRIVVGKDLALPDDPNVFVVGDAAAVEDMTGNYPKYLPGVAQVAIQAGKYAARIIKNGTRREFRQPFKYFDKGNMATIGRGKAILETGKLKLGGFLAWVGWSIIHVMYLIGFRNRVKVMVEWLWYYLSFQPGSRIIYWREETKQTFEKAGRKEQQAPAEV